MFWGGGGGMFWGGFGLTAAPGLNPVVLRKMLQVESHNNLHPFWLLHVLSFPYEKGGEQVPLDCPVRGVTSTILPQSDSSKQHEAPRMLTELHKKRTEFPCLMVEVIGRASCNERRPPRRLPSEEHPTTREVRRSAEKRIVVVKVFVKLLRSRTVLIEWSGGVFSHSLWSLCVLKFLHLCLGFCSSGR